MLAVKVPQLPVNKMGHLEATNCLCIMFATCNGLKSSGATMNHMINRSSSEQGRPSATFYYSGLNPEKKDDSQLNESRMYPHHDFGWLVNSE